MITAIIIAQNEPEWVKKLSFGGVPKMIDETPTAPDAKALTDDGCTLVFERKTPTDFLNRMRDDSLMPQLTKLAEMRIAQQRADEKLTYLPYLVITGSFLPGSDGKIVADGRQTGWTFERLHGEFISIQEMGIVIVYANGDADYEKCIIRIGKRNRNPEQKILVSRPARMLGPQFDFLAGIQGVEIANSQKILDWCDGNLGQGLPAFIDLDQPSPIPMNVRKRFRTQVLRMQDCEKWELVGTQLEEQIIEGEKHAN